MLECGTQPCSGVKADATIRYFSLARYALLEALKGLGVGKRGKVLLPSFICRDLLAPIALAGAEPCWYSVRPDMSPEFAPESWPAANVVLAVNFFGFPQALEPFERYARLTGAVLIEDNAHGFLSRDPIGEWLGSRAEIGLLSMRKTLRLPDGAALLLRQPEKMVGELSEQLPFAGEGIHGAQLFKQRIRRIPLLGPHLLRAAVLGTRTIRKWKTGSAVPVSDAESEKIIRNQPYPWSELPEAISNIDAASEIARRRRLYELCAAEGRRAGVLPVFSSLPDNCAPYGYPFRSNSSAEWHAMQMLADRLGLDLVSWPDLPAEIESTSPPYYKDVLLINFLW